MTLRLASFYAIVFLFGGIQIPFWPVWLESRGMSAAEIGLILSASTVARFAGQMTVAHVADRRGERRRMIILVLLGAFAAHLLFIPAEGFWLILAINLLAGLFLSAVLPLSENLTLLTAHRQGLDYGRIRLWGSFTFIAGATAGGWILVGRHADIILWSMLAGLAASALTALWLPDTRAAIDPRRLAPAIELLKDRGFLAFLATLSLLQASHAAYYGFASLHWRAAGHSEDVIGALWAIGVIAEIVLFMYSARLMARFGPVGMLALAAAGGAVRWTAIGATTSLAVLFVVQTFHALTFAAMHVAAMRFLLRAVPSEYSATAQSLYSGLTGGLAQGLALVVAGWLYESTRGGAFYAMALLSAAALGTLPGLLRAWRAGAPDMGSPSRNQ